MNKGYVQIGDLVIISDENGNYTQSEYYDNLDKVLVQENVIEEMEERIQDLTKKSKIYPVEKKKYTPYIFYFAVASVLAMPIVVGLLTGTNPYLESIDTVFGTVNVALYHSLCTGVFGLPLASLVTIADYLNYKDIVEKGKGINSELEFLKNQIEKEKENLINLKDAKTNDNLSEEILPKKVDDLQQLKILRNNLELFYDLGNNDKKYYRYYQKGKLDKKLHKKYGTVDVDLVKEYLQKKGPTLTKKRTNNKIK